MGDIAWIFTLFKDRRRGVIMIWITFQEYKSSAMRIRFPVAALVNSVFINVQANMAAGAR